MSEEPSRTKNDQEEEEEERKKFANDFKPTFSASKLGEICSPRSREATHIKFLRSFRPFSEIKLETTSVSSPAKKTSIYKPKVLLSESEKADIKRQLDESIDLDELKFDDDKIIDSFDEKLQKTSNDGEIQFLMSRLAISEEDETAAGSGGGDQSDDSESAYITAQSDEECFKKYCDKDGTIEAKSKQAVRYISSMRGRKMERSILNKINTSYDGYNFEAKKTKKYVDYGKFKIVGIIDGLSETKKTILEIKTRKNFESKGKTITPRERLQALTYMNMFACERCLFVESGPKGELKETVLDYDHDEFKREILDILERFTEKARDYDQVEFEGLLIKYNVL